MSATVTTEALKNARIAVLGYGSQGRSHVLNLRDSGLDVVVGLRPGGPTALKAKADGVTVLSPEEAVKGADLVAVLTPDMVQPQLYTDVIEANIKPGAALLFAHGFNVHFKTIVPRGDIDVILVAPKGPGHLVRTEFEIGRGVPCLYATFQGVSGKATELAKAYAAGLGGARALLIETDFKEETETDLFGEQAVLCGGTSELVLKGFETLVEAGYRPEIAYYEVLHELKLIVDLFYAGGLSYMRYSVSDTAEYGDYTAGPKIIDAGTREAMKGLLTEIQNGNWAAAWIAENESGRDNFLRMRDEHANSQIEEVGKGLRAMMPFLKQGNRPVS